MTKKPIKPLAEYPEKTYWFNTIEELEGYLQEKNLVLFFDGSGRQQIWNEIDEIMITTEHIINKRNAMLFTLQRTARWI